MRVGFVLAGVFTGSSIALCPSVASLFPDDGKDTLIIFPGGKLNSPNSLEQMKNSIYDLVNEDNIDGTIVWSSSLSGSVNSTVVLKRFEEILSKPLVTIDGKSDSFPKIPNVCFDAYEGSRFLIQCWGRSKMCDDGRLRKSARSRSERESEQYVRQNQPHCC